MSGDIVKIQPQQFVHILDQNSNVVLLELGPQCRVLKTNERLQGGPFPCVVVPPGHYCTIKDPCTKYEAGKATELKHGEFEVRLHKAPFPLYPGESLVGAEGFGRNSTDFQKAIKLLPVILVNEAFVLEALNDFDDNGVRRVTGEQWQVEGPCTYLPNGNASIVKKRKAKTMRVNESLRVTATRDFTDRNGIKRVTGQEWIVRQEGAYLPDTFEEIVGVERATILKQNVAVHLCATTTVTDHFKKTRVAGERWMVTCEETDTLHPMIGVEVERVKSRTVLKQNEYCKVTNCVDKEGRPQMGRVELRCGPTSFFLHPEEEIIEGIEHAHVLQKDEAVVLQALEHFTEKVGSDLEIAREPGARWMVAGPQVYIPPVEVKVLWESKAMALAQNEGVYIRNIQTGQVRAVMGPQLYLPNEFEEPWEKELPQLVEEMLKQGGGMGDEDIRKIAYFEQSIDPSVLKGRDKTRVVSYRCPHNTACQVLNHLTKTARVIYGPDLVLLGPYENFNILSLSAGKPKKQNALKSLALMLGPDFITDILEVETSDHARLRVKLAFNNHFKYDKSDPESGKRIFSVPDFIGFACRQIGSRIRGAVAQICFDEFHRHSAQVIKAAVFGVDENQQIRSELVFAANNMVVTGIDVQSIEPVDLKMRDSLMKSIQMAIEISTMAIEQGAVNDAKRLEQKAQGELERAKLTNEKEQEMERTKLLELQALTAAVESTGQAVAEAQAKKEAMYIEYQSHIVSATLKAEAEKIEHQCQLELKKNAQVLELEYMKARDMMELHKERETTAIDIKKFEDQVGTLGKDTIQAIATAGPDHQVALLQGLGLQSTLITDGNTPINLFNTLKGLVPVSE